MALLRISVRDLSKVYCRSEPVAPAGRQRQGWLRSIVAAVSPGSTDHRQSFHALKDVSFDVFEGDRIGIIGRNGAGKSTLLKILSRVSYPTTGEIRIKGRLTSLLEVGTGFEQNLSGRDNIFLNASLLGLTRAEIKKRFDAIVAFSGVGDFLDMPVKHYSSGMYMRLAFSIAAHIEPDILLLDEVLAVGDMAFQQKCLGKIDEITKDEKRVLLFVSHSLGLVAQYCNKVLWLDNGQIRYFGEVTAGISLYTEFMSPKGTQPMADRNDRRGTGRARITGIRFEDDDGIAVDAVRTGQAFRIVVEYEGAIISDTHPNDVFVNVIFANEKGQRLFGTPNDVVGSKLRIANGPGRFICRVETLPLLPGVYSYTVGIMVDRQLVDKLNEAGVLLVLDGDVHGTRQLPVKQFGDVVVRYRWTDMDARHARQPAALEEPVA